LRDGLGLWLLAVTALGLEAAMDSMGELLEEDVGVSGGQGDGLSGVVGDAADA